MPSQSPLSYLPVGKGGSLEDMLLFALNQSGGLLNRGTGYGSSVRGLGSRLQSFNELSGPLIEALLALEGLRIGGLNTAGFLGGFSRGLGGGGVGFA